MPRLPVLAAAVLAGIFFLTLVTRPADEPPLPDLISPAAKHEVLVHLDDAALLLTDEVIGQRLGREVIGRVGDIGVVRMRTAEGEPVAQAVQRLMRLPGVKAAEPNHLVWSTLIPNDPFYSAQSSYLELVGAPDAWSSTTGDSSVIVAVLDSGIDLSHPDLQAKVWTNLFEAENDSDDDHNGCVDDIHGCNFVARDSADPSCKDRDAGSVDDDNGHGTFVSGIIAAAGNNAIGLSGVAPGVTVLPVKILDCLGGGTAADAAEALLYAAKVGARVANISFGADGESLTLATAIREAYGRYGMTIIAATGNEGVGKVTFPARLPQTLAVASSGTAFDTGARSPFSDWGPEVGVAAPGLNIVSTVPKPFCETTWLCVEGEPYAVASGTSFAAPIVSGLAALLISKHPNLSPEGVREIIESTAQPLIDGSTRNWDGAGRIRMGVALALPRYSLGVSGVAKQ